MNYVQQDGDTHAVSGIDEFLQLFGRAVPGARSEEAGDLVTEGCGNIRVSLNKRMSYLQA